MINSVLHNKEALKL
jgi:hypothetical protein